MSESENESESDYHLFDTDIGVCGVAWNARGITCVMLAERTPRATERKLREKVGGATRSDPPRPVASAVERIRRHLAGTPQDMRDIRLDMTKLPPFRRRVYEALRQVRAGSVLSYAELARQAGSPRAARAVGQAMANNPFPLIVPCHRVLATGGALAGFSAFGGQRTKRLLLEREGARTGRPAAHLAEEKRGVVAQGCACVRLNSEAPGDGVSRRIRP